MGDIAWTLPGSAHSIDPDRLGWPAPPCGREKCGVHIVCGEPGDQVEARTVRAPHHLVREGCVWERSCGESDAANTACRFASCKEMPWVHVTLLAEHFDALSPVIPRLIPRLVHAGAAAHQRGQAHQGLPSAEALRTVSDPQADDLRHAFQVRK